jgi:lysophospholipase L1-like esterase
MESQHYNNEGEAEMSQWVSIWGQSHTDISSTPPDPTARTIRFWVVASIGGKGIRIKFENKVTLEGFTIGKGALIVGSCSYPITFGGQPLVQLPIHADLTCDEIPCEIMTGDLLEVRLFFPKGQRPISGNAMREKVELSPKGNYVNSNEFPVKNRFFQERLLFGLLMMNSAIPAISGIEVAAQNDTGAVVVFGDSIAQQCHWTKPLEQRLIREFEGKVSLINKSMGGNRLLHDATSIKSCGEAGIKRFRHDVLSVKGIKTVVFALGTNDIGQPGIMQKTPVSQLPSVEEFGHAVEQLVKKAHESGVRFIATTIAPRNIQKGFLAFPKERDQLRNEINGWFRTAGIFDTLWDFDKIIQSPYGTGLRPDMDSGDGVHPNDNGGIILANSIDLRTLIG